MNRNGTVVLVDDNGRDGKRTRSSTRQGQGKEARGWRPGPPLAEWDPYTIPILTDVAGRVKFQDLVEEITVKEHIDEVTGLSRSVIIEPKDPEHRPRIYITDDAGKNREDPWHQEPGQVQSAGGGPHLRPGG
jgi:DNA-directed RNA polymerase subunit beta'